MASMTSSGIISVRALLARSLYACTALSAGLTLHLLELKPRQLLMAGHTSQAELRKCTYAHVRILQCF